MSIKITALIENYAVEEGLAAEHGLSLYIEKDGVNILFDTGPSASFLENAKHLGVDLSAARYVVLSHAHYDHAGGLQAFQAAFPGGYTLLLNKDYFTHKYWHHIEEKYYEYVGTPFSQEYLMEQKIPTMLLTGEDYELMDEEGNPTGIHIMSKFSTLCDFEAVDATAVMRRREEYLPDTFDEEQVIAIPTEKGIVVITGCSHNGIVNICETVKARLGSNIYAVIGGTHLIVADEARITKTIDYFRRENIQIAGVCHCTGEMGLAAFQEQCEKFYAANTGTVTVL